MINVLAPGIYSTIQDFGRIGFQEYGVPYSGVMDRKAATLANAILGNSPDLPVLEITMQGPKLQFQCTTTICVTGANLSAKLNNSLFSNNKPMMVKSGDILSFGSLKQGIRAYVAVKDGFQTEQVMHSYSMYSGITKKKKLEKGDVLKISTANNLLRNYNASIKINFDYFNLKTLEVFKGPEFDMLSKKQKNQLLNTEFTISKNNNRMAYQFNELLENNLKPIITSPVLPGTVQLTPSGNLIVLMRDCQTTGGYPRVLQLKESAINLLAQKYTNQAVLFQLV
ncbi:allophanate hydrolase [Seonamhaeicola sp. S2-3]|uniref:5-oxoprolinase subunit C family protein n=1 Tax=Seonamhaeicola sp. S2-3 TaxID=1936081 RepID=UPI000972A85D|nr:biotin-dependent carboxyltransferase family protein [Seonamhaeicola sp. S2-3]APY12199.1 allophanate hydrolase [Seonamhaeicola sp. S2-3]